MSQPRENQDVPAVSVEIRKPGGIGRRAVLQSLAGGVGAGLVLPGIGEAQHPVHTHLANAATVAQADKKAATKAYTPAFLDAHQLQTLEVLAERIVPGSTKAKVAPFVDQLLGVDSQANQRTFLSALGAMEMQAIQGHSKPWKALTAAQQDELLTKASTAESGMRPGSGPPNRQGPPTGTATIRDHFEHLKGWIAGAYYSSEIGMRELGWTGEMVFDKPPGCDHPDQHA